MVTSSGTGRTTGKTRREEGKPTNCSYCLLQLCRKYLKEPNKYIDESFIKTLVFPIYKTKKKDPHLTRNYKTISVLHVLRNLVCSILASRMYKAIKDNPEVMDKEQAAFLPGSETMSSVATLYEQCQRRSIGQKITIIVSVDVEQAYASVRMRILMVLLRRHGFDDTFIDQIMVIMEKKKWNLVLPTINNLQEFTHMAGLPEGDPCSPILYNIYTNGLFKTLTHSIEIPIGEMAEYIETKGGRFADDVYLLQETARRAAKAVHELIQAYTKLGLKVEPSKSQILIVFPKEVIESISSLKVEQADKNKRYQDLAMKVLNKIYRNEKGYEEIKKMTLVNSMRYLGIEIHWTWDLAKIASLTRNKRRWGASQHLNLIEDP